jgi:hypothetical protein
MELEEEENNRCNQQNIFQITQVMEVARALTTVPMKNDDQYIWISMQAVVFFEIIVCENQTFCLM